MLVDGGVYFDPENPDSIASAIEALLAQPEKCQQLAARARELAGQYSWRRCSAEKLFLLLLKQLFK